MPLPGDDPISDIFLPDVAQRLKTSLPGMQTITYVC